MARLNELPFDNTFARLPPAFHEVVDPAPLADPSLVAFNPAAADLIGLDPGEAANPAFVHAMAGHGRIPGSEPVAALYAGHQFGVWVPQLGDGRAILLGEVVHAGGERWDLQLKGAGPTRFSRMGDGRSVLRSAIREYLAGEALHGLGIPTTRALCVVGSSEVVYRETPETAATLLRLAPSHVRFGSFQVFAARRQTELVKQLADYVIALHFPGLVLEPDRYRLWLRAVVDRTAELVADWMAAGFAHGVLNTDNMSVLGLTLDFGPYGFQDAYDPHFVCNHSDVDGRYAFDRQPAIGLWNLARFAESLLSLVSADEANHELARYPSAFERRYGARMRARLGLETVEDDDVPLVGGLLDLMADARADYARTFRALAAVEVARDGADPQLAREIGDTPRLERWLALYRSRLRREGSDDAGRGRRMRRTNPRYVLRNYLAQEAIELAQQGDVSGIARLVRVLSRPFDDHPGEERLAAPPPAWARELVVSCSS